MLSKIIQLVLCYTLYLPASLCAAYPLSVLSWNFPFSPIFLSIGCLFWAQFLWLVSRYRIPLQRSHREEGRFQKHEISMHMEITLVHQVTSSYVNVATYRCRMSVGVLLKWPVKFSTGLIWYVIRSVLLNESGSHTKEAWNRYSREQVERQSIMNHEPCCDHNPNLQPL